MTPDRRFEVVLLDDQLSPRRATELLLREGGFWVAGTASSVAEAHGLLRRRRYDAALLEIALGGESVAGLVAELVAERPGVPLVVWAAAGADPSTLAALRAAGPVGLLSKGSPPERLFQALRAAAAGTAFIDPGFAAPLPAPPRTGSPTDPQAGIPADVASLSPREREILRLLADGLSGAQVAEELFLSAETVRTHVRNATRKLAARTRTQAVARLVAAELPARRQA